MMEQAQAPAWEALAEAAQGEAMMAVVMAQAQEKVPAMEQGREQGPELAMALARGPERALGVAPASVPVLAQAQARERARE